MGMENGSIIPQKVEDLLQQGFEDFKNLYAPKAFYKPVKIKIWEYFLSNN